MSKLEYSDLQLIIKDVGYEPNKIKEPVQLDIEEVQSVIKKSWDEQKTLRTDVIIENYYTGIDVDVVFAVRLSKIAVNKIMTELEKQYPNEAEQYRAQIEEMVEDKLAFDNSKILHSLNQYKERFLSRMGLSKLNDSQLDKIAQKLNYEQLGGIGRVVHEDTLFKEYLSGLFNNAGGKRVEDLAEIMNQYYKLPNYIQEAINDNYNPSFWSKNKVIADLKSTILHNGYEFFKTMKERENIKIATNVVELGKGLYVTYKYLEND